MTGLVNWQGTRSAQRGRWHGRRLATAGGMKWIKSRWKVVIYWAFVVLAGCTFFNDSSSPDFRQTAIFEKRTDQGIELYLLPLQDDNPQLVTLVHQHEPYERYELSPDGSHLAVYFGQNLRLINLTTFEEAVLENNLVWPTVYIENINHKIISWSPSGDKLAVLTGGPSRANESLVSTTLKIFDIQTQTLDFVLDHGTWINDLAWSADSGLLSFSESNIPCWYIESCEGDAMVTWNLTTLVHSGTNRWEVLSSIQLDPPIENKYWRWNSICQLSVSPGNEFVSYQSPCPLGEFVPERNLFITTIHPPHQILNITQQERYVSDSRRFVIHWQDAANQFTIIYLGGAVGIGPIRSLDTYKMEFPIAILLNQENLEGLVDTRFGLINFSPDNQYGIGNLEGNNSLLMQFNDSTTTSTSLTLPSISLMGLWLPGGYLTQSEDRIVFIDPETGVWEVVHDNLPEDFVLVGWQILE